MTLRSIAQFLSVPSNKWQAPGNDFNNIIFVVGPGSVLNKMAEIHHEICYPQAGKSLKRETLIMIL